MGVVLIYPYFETRADVLPRKKELFTFWKQLGMEYMFLGVEAIDAEGLRKFCKRVSLGRNFEALQFARSLGISVAINIIADPDWDRDRFKVIRQSRRCPDSYQPNHRSHAFHPVETTASDHRELPPGTILDNHSA